MSTTQGVGKRVRRIPSRYRDSDDESQTKNKVENKLRKKIVVNKDNSLEIQAEKYKRMREINNKSSKRFYENKRNKDRELAREESDLVKHNIKLKEKEASLKEEMKNVSRQILNLELMERESILEVENIFCRIINM